MIGYFIARLSGPLARAIGIEEELQTQVVIIGIGVLIDPIGAAIGAVREWADAKEKARPPAHDRDNGSRKQG